MKRLLILLLALALLPAALAANPGHGASAISAGTFEAGDFIVNGNLNVTSTNDICIDGGNCLSAAGTIDGSGTTNTLAIWTGSGSLGDSIISETGASVDINGSLNFPNDASVISWNGVGTFSISNFDKHVSIGPQASPQSGTTALGYRAGYSSTGTDNIFIGTNAGESSSTSNTLYIDNSNTATPLIYGEFDNNILQLNAETRINGTINGLPASGADTQATSFIIAGGKSTGNAPAGQILFQTSDPGGPGSSLQPLSTKGGFSGADFYVDSDTLYVDSSTNSVGIGTTNPAVQLDVIGTIEASTDICIDGGNCLSSTTTGSGSTNTIPLWTGSATLSNSAITQSSGDINIDSNTLFVDSSADRVGIGTTSPQEALEVDGGVRLNTAAGKGTCDSSKRGTLWVEQSSSGTDDYVWACLRNSTDNHNWIMVARGS